MKLFRSLSNVSKGVGKACGDIGQSLNLANHGNMYLKRHYISSDHEALRDDWDNVGKLLKQYIENNI